MNNKHLAYAQNFISFLIQELDDKPMQNIKEIILFGSAARNSSTKKSDIDIFINLHKNDKKTDKNVQIITEGFYSSVFCAKYWKLIGIQNEINCITGKLDEWEDLKASIISDGITLYAKYQGETAKGRKGSYVFIYWNKITPESKRIFLSKKLFGYNYKGKRYKGIIEDTKAVKPASNCIFAPIENADMILQQFRDLKIPFRTIYVNKI